jgi:transcriptional regulator with XRE-family HTH domain
VCQHHEERKEPSVILLREQIGASLRRRRLDQGRTLRQVSQDARVSLGYLSEVERGQKEASSELLAAICTALELRLSDLLLQVTSQVEKDEIRERLAPVPTGGRPSASASVAVAA